MIAVLFVFVVICEVVIYVQYRAITDHSTAKAKRLRAILWTLLGFLISPLIAAVIVATIYSVPNHSVIGLLSGILICYAFTFAAACVFGAPAYLLLYFLGYIRWWSSLIVGFVIGVLTIVIIEWAGYSSLRNAFNDLARGNLLVCGVAGAISAVTFWLVWRHGQKPLKVQMPIE